ncbi:MAG: 5'/3'-nucleotidase SurE, partial [Chloroflexi bacterium]|nr:5'/3'-nucleotidase SurE [Chloroflexota bacterium]
MNMKKKPHILLTNDDGIRSPGLWMAAKELSRIGYVTVVAPREQSSGMGRSLPNTSDGIIREEKVQVDGQEWSVYAVGGSPAQAVLHGVLEIVPHKPDLVVSGINYGP